MTLTDHATVIGRSPAARQIDEDIRVAAASDAKVLITGETGAGKDVVARVLHQRSMRRHASFSAINCAGMPDTLLESELFGHLRGSFTGAFRDKAGLLEGADRGTAFLDEAGEMSLRMQGVLLRFLETGEVQRVGSERAARRVNVRVVAATNRDLGSLIASGAFREDLYYRLNVVRIHVPPLRERLEDVPVLFAHFVDRFARQYKLAPCALTGEAETRLKSHPWPGNVRELRNLVERLVVSGPGPLVRAEDIVLDERPGLREAVTPLSPRAVAVSATRPAPVRVTVRETATARAMVAMLEDGFSFWDVVHAPFMSRDLSREDLRAIIRAGLQRTSGNYRMLVQLFNMPPEDYKRLLSFLRKHQCQVPFHTFRGLGQEAARMAPDTSTPAYLEAAGM